MLKFEYIGDAVVYLYIDDDEIVISILDDENIHLSGTFKIRRGKKRIIKPYPEFRDLTIFKISKLKLKNKVMDEYNYELE